MDVKRVLVLSGIVASFGYIGMGLWTGPIATQHELWREEVAVSNGTALTGAAIEFCQDHGHRPPNAAHWEEDLAPTPDRFRSLS